jgi:predicted MPP superfamily phosphohydrolase
MDNSLDLLPEAQRALSRLRAPLGVFGILGNHDYYADRPDLDHGYAGCRWIMEGMEAVGVRMLRSRHAGLRQGHDELLIVGLDWTGMVRGNPNTYSSAATRAALRRALDGYRGDAPRILLAHHPHAFIEAGEFQAALTLAGHTHGGGQVVVAEHNGRPLALGSAVFRYVKGLYREGNRYLYVSRGLGFVALPIRINCPPEISRFQLVKA